MEKLKVDTLFGEFQVQTFFDIDTQTDNLLEVSLKGNHIGVIANVYEDLENLTADEKLQLHNEVEILFLDTE